MSETVAVALIGAELCSGADARTLFYDTITEVIVPRLEELGLRAGDASARRSAWTLG
jgi:hypothetical protein